MKIVHVVRQFLPSIGGLEDVVFNLATEQIKLGHNVKVFTTNSDFQANKQLPAVSVESGIHVQRYPWYGSKRYPICWLPINELNRFDLVHVHAVDFLVEYLSLQKRLGRLRPRLVLTTHGGFFHTNKQAGMKKLFFKYITPFSLSQFDAVTCCSINDYALFKDLNRNVSLIENGVGFQKLGKALNIQKINDFIYFGRFSENKRLVELVELFAGVDHSDVRLKIIGRSKTGDIASILSKIAELGCLERVQLLTDISDQEILHHVASARFTISASSYEGFGLSIVELMAYGLVPLLSAEPPSFKRFVEESGVGAQFTLDKNSIEQAIHILTTQWSESQGQAAQNYAGQFAWPSVAVKYLNVYQ
ncbi:glycosyltransferase family 4 protein [Endozoicomonas sp. ONNA2]|uniref:glycosyltransferase family 4 protein n=1 Tax=Endozoicomonas sp. ONNA2 TaxID=2828741 RepID=UPI00214972CD|nr:glycosyltransferase family 4 protein [Endozoicomonas sp. ONNA2]